MPPVKPKKYPKIPVGYRPETNENYTIKAGDYHFYKSWMGIIPSYRITLQYSGLVGKTIKHLRIMLLNNNDIFIAVKKDAKPRFKCDKPYPYGY